MHQDQPAVAGGPEHRPQDGAVVAVHPARVGREQLERRHPLGDERIHLGQGPVIHVAHGHVEAVIHAAVAVCLGVPRVQPLAQRVAAALGGEVDDRRGAAEGRGPGAGLEGVLRGDVADRQLHVGVGVDRARHHELARSVDHPVRRPARARLHCHDALAVDEHVGLPRAVRVHDDAVGD